MWRSALVIAVVIPMVLTAASVAAQPGTDDPLVQSLKRDIEALREGLNRVQNDRHIKAGTLRSETT